MQEWLENVGEGVPGLRDAEGRDRRHRRQRRGELLLVQRADSGIWLYPTGWADVGYSPAEVAVKEVAEETGIECEPVRRAVGDRRPADGLLPLRDVHAAVPLPAIGGELRAHPLETADVGWFGRDELPSDTAGAAVVGADGVRRDRRRGLPDRLRRRPRADVARRLTRSAIPVTDSALVAVAEELLDLLHQLARV